MVFYFFHLAQNINRKFGEVAAFQGMILEKKLWNMCLEHLRLVGDFEGC